SPSPTVLYTLLLHDALPIYTFRIYFQSFTRRESSQQRHYRWSHFHFHSFYVGPFRDFHVPTTQCNGKCFWSCWFRHPPFALGLRSEEHTSELQSRENLVCRL